VRGRNNPLASDGEARDHEDMQPTVDDFRALARSSPWRWTTLHFSRHQGIGVVEAWVRRPGELLVRQSAGPDEYVSGAPYASSPRLATLREAAGLPEPPGPTFRPDGLVAERPEGYAFEHGDPMWENYTWTAMLDPDELSHHVDLDDVRAGETRGRETWSARLRPVDGYDPRCGCCPLLWSEVSVHAEYAGEPERLARFEADGYPDAYDVVLDVQTAVVVSLEPVGGGREDFAFTVEIHEVDADLDAVFAGRENAE
jgi:hypothetical protein